MAKFIDIDGLTQDVNLDISIYKEAADAGMSVESYVNQKYPASEDAPAFRQFMASSGLYLQANNRYGIRPTKLQAALDGTGLSAVTNTGNAVPQSRILFPAAVLSAIEDRLARDLTTASAAYDQLIAVTDNIPGTDYKRVITNYDRPSAGRSRATAQLAKPQRILGLTVSERTNTVPAISLGIEWSDQYAATTSLDIVSLSIARQVAIERDARANEDLLAILNGDEDVGQGALSAVSGAYVRAGALDPAITTTGKLTQTAWVKFLYRGGEHRVIDWIVTDLDGALAIENREGKPVIVGDDGTSPRINSQARIANPLIPAEVKIFVTRNPNWPAGTLMGVDSRYGIHRVNSLSANYQAVEQNVIRRSNEMRWDSGSVSYRLYDEAFSVLELRAAA